LSSVRDRGFRFGCHVVLPCNASDCSLKYGPFFGVYLLGWLKDNSAGPAVAEVVRLHADTTEFLRIRLRLCEDLLATPPQSVQKQVEMFGCCQGIDQRAAQCRDAAVSRGDEVELARFDDGSPKLPLEFAD